MKTENAEALFNQEVYGDDLETLITVTGEDYPYTEQDWEKREVVVRLGPAGKINPGCFPREIKENYLLLENKKGIKFWYNDKTYFVYKYVNPKT